MIRQILPWIAGQNRLHVDVVASGHELIGESHASHAHAIWQCRAGEEGPTHTEVAAVDGLQRAATLDLGNTRDLPAVDYPTHELVSVVEAALLIHIGGVEDVGSVVRQNAVVVTNIN